MNSITTSVYTRRIHTNTFVHVSSFSTPSSDGQFCSSTDATGDSLDRPKCTCSCAVRGYHLFKKKGLQVSLPQNARLLGGQLDYSPFSSRHLEFFFLVFFLFHLFWWLMPCDTSTRCFANKVTKSFKHVVGHVIIVDVLHLDHRRRVELHRRGRGRERIQRLCRRAVSSSTHTPGSECHVLTD